MVNGIVQILKYVASRNKREQKKNTNYVHQSKSDMISNKHMIQSLVIKPIKLHQTSKLHAMTNRQTSPASAQEQVRANS